MSTPAKELQENGFFLAKGVVPQAKLDEISDEVKGLSKLLGATGSSYHEIWNSLVDIDRSRGGLLYNAVKKLPSVNSLPESGVVQFAKKNLLVESPAIVDINFRIDAPAEDKFSFDWHQDYWFSMCSPYALVAWTPLVPTDDEIGGVEVIPNRDEEMRILKVRRNEEYNSYSSSVILDESLPDNSTVIPKVMPGDCLYFRFHLLHRSIANVSKNRQRWTIQTRIADLADKDFIEQQYKPGVVTKDYISFLDGQDNKYRITK